MYINKDSNNYNKISTKNTKIENQQSKKTNSSKDLPKSNELSSSEAYKFEKSEDISSDKNEQQISHKDFEKMVFETEQKTKQLTTLVSTLFNTQANKFSVAGYDELSYMTKEMQNSLEHNTLYADADTIAKAKEDISEDGYYGVNQTSDRLVNFAKALSGGDASNIELLRDAVIDGFSAVSNDLDNLPDICKDTFNATMDKFDVWAEESGVTLSEVERF